MARKLKRPASRGSVNNVILEVLSTGEKYGYEIIKEVEEKTNGEVKLKQPSLYSSLSRFEAKGYVSSYWKDSDIGGKRHYYKLTALGTQVCKTMLSKNNNSSGSPTHSDQNDSIIFSSTTNENEYNDDIENNNDDVIFEIDENNDDTVDIFNNDTSIKLQHYANFDISDRLNELLKDNNKNNLAKSHLKNNINDSNNDVSPQNDIDDSIVNVNETNNVDTEEFTSNDEPTQNTISSNITEISSIDKRSDDFIEKSIVPITNNNVSSSLVNDNITEQINQLNEQLDSIKNAEVESNINEVGNENNLKNIYNEIKYKEQSKVEPIKHTPLTHLEQLKRMESMEILYGNPTNYYFPDETQETISQDEEQIDIEAFIKLKNELNNKKFLYNKIKIYRKKVKPYIFQTIFHSNGSTKKNLNSDKQKNESKVKYKFDEFGIMKIIDDSNSSENKTEKQNQVIDNVGYRISKTTLNPQILQSPSYRPTHQKISQPQLSSVEIERRNQSFAEKFDKISKEKFNFNNSDKEKQYYEQSVMPQTTDTETTSTKENSLLNFNNNDEIEDSFIDFENNENNQGYQNNLPDSTIQQDDSYQNNNNFIDDFEIDNTENAAIKQYGKIDTFNNEINNNYVSVNKVKCVFGIIFTLLLLTEITITLLLLKKNNLIFNYDSALYITSYVIATVIGIFFLMPFILNMNKKIENTFKLSYSMSFSSLSFIIICVLTYSINTLFGFSFKNGIEYLSKMIIPILFGFNILIAPCIYYVILKIKSFYK